jgi:hypothetical protein
MAAPSGFRVRGEAHRMKPRTKRNLSARAREDLRFRQAMGLALMAADTVLVLGKGQEAQARDWDQAARGEAARVRGRKRSSGPGASSEPNRSPDKKWVGLAYRLEDRLRLLGLEPPKEDAWLHGSLNVLDYRCRVLSAFIEGLAEWPARPGEWEQLGNVVARMWAMAHTMRASLHDLEPALERLLAAICRVHSPGRHLRLAARSQAARSHTTRSRKRRA